VMDQFALQITDQATADFGIDHNSSASAEIDRGEAKRLVHSHQELAGAQDTFLISQRLVECFTESDPDIFNRVVLIDIEIALAGELQIESPVSRKQLEHVIEEADSG